jgi:hypothetical protein
LAATRMDMVADAPQMRPGGGSTGRLISLVDPQVGVNECL